MDSLVCVATTEISVREEVFIQGLNLLTFIYTKYGLLFALFWQVMFEEHLLPRDLINCNKSK